MSGDGAGGGGAEGSGCGSAEEGPEGEDDELRRRRELLARVREANEQSLKWPR